MGHRKDWIEDTKIIKDDGNGPAVRTWQTCIICHGLGRGGACECGFWVNRGYQQMAESNDWKSGMEECLDVFPVSRRCAHEGGWWQKVRATLFHPSVSKMLGERGPWGKGQVPVAQEGVRGMIKSQADLCFPSRDKCFHRTQVKMPGWASGGTGMRQVFVFGSWD